LHSLGPTLLRYELRRFRRSIRDSGAPCAGACGCELATLLFENGLSPPTSWLRLLLLCLGSLKSTWNVSFWSNIRPRLYFPQSPGPSSIQNIHHIRVNKSSKGVRVEPSTMSRSPRLLALDGGVVKGLSSLFILREIMDEIQRKTGPSTQPLPSEYFDLIGGTGTGGLIAIMLGRLRMVHIKE
jgi:hypothetical protein